MNITEIQYPGYTIEIPDGLLKPFRLLSRILNDIDFDHPVDLLSFPVTSELIKTCDECVCASVGKVFAHDMKVGNALAQWVNLSQYERATIIIEAAEKTEPFDISSVFGAGPDIGRD